MLLVMLLAVLRVNSAGAARSMCENMWARTASTAFCEALVSP